MPNTEDKPTKLTPMMKQYMDMRRSLPDDVLELGGYELRVEPPDR